MDEPRIVGRVHSDGDIRIGLFVRDGAEFMLSIEEAEELAEDLLFRCRVARRRQLARQSKEKPE